MECICSSRLSGASRGTKQIAGHTLKARITHVLRAHPHGGAAHGAATACPAQRMQNHGGRLEEPTRSAGSRWRRRLATPDAGSQDADSLGADSLGADSLEAGSLGAGSLGAGSLEAGSLEAVERSEGISATSVERPWTRH